MATLPQRGNRVSLDIGSREASAGQYLALAVGLVACALAAPDHWGSWPSPAALLRIFAVPAVLGWGLLGLWQGLLARTIPGRQRWGWGPAWLTGQAALAVGLFAFGWYAPFPAQRLADLSDPVGTWLAVPAGSVAGMAWIATRDLGAGSGRRNPEFGDPPPRPFEGDLAAVLVYPGALALAGTTNVHGQFQAAVAMAVAASVVAILDPRALHTPAAATVLAWVLQAGSGALLPLIAMACLAFLCAPRWRCHGPCVPLAVAGLVLLAFVVFNEDVGQRQLPAAVRTSLSVAAGIAVATFSAREVSAEDEVAPKSPLSRRMQLGMPAALLLGAVALIEDWPEGNHQRGSAVCAVLTSMLLTRLALSQWARTSSSKR
jgi:hypothetical protein